MSNTNSSKIGLTGESKKRYFCHIIDLCLSRKNFLMTHKKEGVLKGKEENIRYRVSNRLNEFI